MDNSGLNLHQYYRAFHDNAPKQMILQIIFPSNISDWICLPFWASSHVVKGGRLIET